MNDNEIVIKPVDKGSAVAIWSKHDYLLEASNQLSDTNVYCKSNSNTLQKVNSEIKSVPRDMFKLKEIDKKNHELSDSQKSTAWKILLTT